MYADDVKTFPGAFLNVDLDIRSRVDPLLANIKSYTIPEAHSAAPRRAAYGMARAPRANYLDLIALCWASSKRRSSPP
jgi:hypothetical protein